MMVFTEQVTFELDLEMWVSRSHFWGPIEQGGKRSWKKKEQHGHHCGDMQKRDMFGNRKKSEAGVQGQGDQDGGNQAMKCKVNLGPGKEGSLNWILFVTGKDWRFSSKE